MTFERLLDADLPLKFIFCIQTILRFWNI